MRCLLVTINAVKIMKTGKEVWVLVPDPHPLGLRVLFCKMGMFLDTLQGLSPVPRTLHLVFASCPDVPVYLPSAPSGVCPVQACSAGNVQMNDHTGKHLEVTELAQTLPHLITHLITHEDWGPLFFLFYR